MPDLSENGQVLLMLGELKGKVGELVHAIANQAQIVNALSDKVHNAAGLPDKVKSNTDRIDGHETRISALESESQRRVGAIGLGAWIVKAAPVLMALAAGAGLMEIVK